jgi:hypothetical protein
MATSQNEPDGPPPEDALEDALEIDDLPWNRGVKFDALYPLNPRPRPLRDGVLMEAYRDQAQRAPGKPSPGFGNRSHRLLQAVEGLRGAAMAANRVIDQIAKARNSPGAVAQVEALDSAEMRANSTIRWIGVTKVAIEKLGEAAERDAAEAESQSNIRGGGNYKKRSRKRKHTKKKKTKRRRRR